MIRIFNFTLSLIIVMSITSCDRLPITPEGKARSAISKMLIDPSSGKFTYINKSKNAICGTVNAKNRMGAYTGSSLFIYDAISGEVELYDGPPDISDYESWSYHTKDGMSGGDEYYNKIETGCQFPEDWKNKCSSVSATAIPRNEKFCTAWKKNDYSTLYEMSHNY
ncbi:MAG: hypothetical protein ACTHLA_04600 [Asticcacaulis sp.]|uniref:hypothetical protein n=1 Tax=Asticcacaulis sp. TaxID=1872648 RepID=UPI003F7C3A1D